jgi:hypothetical protein
VPPKEVLRHVVPNYHKSHPQASERDLAKLANCSRGVVQRTLAKLKNDPSLKDAPRSGRPLSLQRELLARAFQIGVDSPVGSSRSVSDELASEGFPSVHLSTVCRAYRRAGVQHGGAKKGLLISARNKAARLAFAARHGGGTTDFRGVMFTDSKITVLDKAGGKVWYFGGKRPSACVPKTSLKVHVYSGVTYYGPTRPVFVTGGGKQKSKILSKKQAFP